MVSRLVLGAAFAAFGYFIPRFFVMFLRYRRLETIDNQLVDTLMLMSNALKAGLSLQQALELVVREMKPPIADEFGRLVKEIHLGVLTDDALRHMRDRVPLEDIRLAVESILTLRETGGNLSETFEVIARTIVERKKVQGKIKALTAQGMAQGIVICAMPLGLLLMFTLVDRVVHGADVRHGAGVGDAGRHLHPRWRGPVDDVQAGEGGRMTRRELTRALAARWRRAGTDVHRGRDDQRVHHDGRIVRDALVPAAVPSAVAGHRVVCVEQRGGHAVVSRLG